MGQSFVQADMVRNSGDRLKNISNTGNKNANVGVFVGYNHLIQETPLFIGLEVGAENHNLKISQEENTSPPVVMNYKTIAKTNNSFTGIGKFGFIVKDLMIYAKAGVVKTNWNLNYAAAFAGASMGNAVKTNKYGSVYGFGVDYKLNSNWMIGVDHSIKSYSDLKLTSGVGNITVKPIINTTSFRLIYSF
jgi:opacity protein-like surface antigen